MLKHFVSVKQTRGRMEILSAAVQRIRTKYFKFRYLRAARSILETEQLAPGTLPFTIVSMVHKRDVISYLVAAKSFTRYANPRRVVVVCDPSVDDSDRILFKRHIPHVELRNAAEFVDSRLPTGGCWERLLAISHYVKTDYVIQLDADTVTVSFVPEVMEAIETQSGFVLGEKPDQKPMSLIETSEVANSLPYELRHIQDVAESKMALACARPEDLYIRGCAGFTGFPSSQEMNANIVAYSLAMQKLIGARWSTWGTEQVTSNYIVANSRNAKILPFPKYCTPDVRNNDTAFLHFIGYCRFVNAKYERTSKRVIESLKTLSA